MTAITRRVDHGSVLRDAGTVAVAVDALDRDSLFRAVDNADPDAILHRLTDLTTGDSASNAALRAHGTRLLVDAAHAAGVRMSADSSRASLSSPAP